MRRTLFLLLGLIGLSTLIVAQSGAQSTTKPAPSCAGVAANDAKNDATTGPFGAGGSGDAAPANVEIQRFWFDRTAGKTTANVEVKKLSKANTSSSDSLSWYVTWTDSEGNIRYVNANSDGNTVTYQYGDLLESVYTPVGDTTGKFYDGDNGVVQIVIPSGNGGAVGSKLDAPYATTTENYEVPGVISYLPNDDNAPDDGDASGGGKAWTVTDCAAGPTGPTGPTGPAGPTTPGQVVLAGQLNVKAKTALGSAKSAAKKKKASVSLTGDASSIEATLYKGAFTKPKRYGKGKLARVSGKAKLKIKLSKKVKKGKYKLTLIGTNPDGARAEKTFKVKFKK